MSYGFKINSPEGGIIYDQTTIGAWTVYAMGANTYTSAGNYYVSVPGLTDTADFVVAQTVDTKPGEVRVLGSTRWWTPPDGGGSLKLLRLYKETDRLRIYKVGPTPTVVARWAIYKRT